MSNDIEQQSATDIDNSPEAVIANLEDELKFYQDEYFKHCDIIDKQANEIELLEEQIYLLEDKLYNIAAEKAKESHIKPSQECLYNAQKCPRIDDHPEGNTNPATLSGIKYDEDKLRMDLIPISLLNGVAEILGFGAEKYSDRNWEKGMEWSRPYGALLRHITAWWGGEDEDSESCYSHLKHAACCIAFLIEYAEKGIGQDNRPPTFKRS